MADIFISYARSDEATARRLATALKAKGFGVWWDEHLPAHRSYSEVIEQRLAEAKAVVVLWSAAAAKSQWVRAEADFARNAGKLVQAQVDDGLPPMPFNQVQCANLKGWRGSEAHKGFSKLASSAGALVSGEERPTPADEPARSRTMPRWGWAAVTVLALLVVAGLLVPRFLGGDSRRPVLAVLPFTSLDQRDSSLVAGIWEDTRQALSRNPQLLVLGPNTAQELAGKGASATAKAADYVLEASVRSVGDRIRVNTNLVRTKDGAQLWSENFDRKLDDVFALQTEIAAEIEGKIRGRLARSGGVQPEHIATSGDAYALYSDARAKVRKRQMGRYEDAARQMEQVVRMDPNFAPGWATLAVIKSFGIANRGRSASSAESDARKAIALAPNLALAHAALGFILGEGPIAEAELRRAVELDPNDFEALNWLANSLDDSRVEDKLKLYSKIVEIEPLWWPAIVNRMELLSATGGQAAMQQELERLERLGDEKLLTVARIKVAEDTNDLSAAIATGMDYYRRASPEDREFLANFLISPLYRLGYLDVADQLSGPLPNRYIPYIRSNDPRAMDMIEAEHGKRGFWTYGFLGIVGPRVYLLNHQGPRLARLYRAVASTPEEFEKVVGVYRLPDIAPGAALALRSAGDNTQATKLLALAEQRAATVPAEPLEKDIRLARIYAVQGRTNDAIGLLSSAVRRGWIPPFLPINTDIAIDPPLAELKSDPRFEPIRQQILGHIAKERAELGPVSLR